MCRLRLSLWWPMLATVRQKRCVFHAAPEWVCTGPMHLQLLLLEYLHARLQGLGIPLPVPKATLRAEAARAKAEAEKQAAFLKVCACLG